MCEGNRSVDDVNARDVAVGSSIAKLFALLKFWIYLLIINKKKKCERFACKELFVL